ncbi:hypothetical protein HDU87_004645 [Geranomyces variabilis]|uniref:Uncharacterized protein n=1 Tax=Geranomyces variabilis TaxID=109894 RepID=A0AAD5XQH6_9FUNG|nr:hypothetical protein HDU87_004645 [Geranomyces variabilis]
MDSPTQYPSPQTLVALIEQSQQMLSQVRQQASSLAAASSPQGELVDAVERFGRVHDNVSAMRRQVVDSRKRVLDDPVFALQQEIEQLQHTTAQKHTAINTYTHFLTTWQQTLHKISSTTNAALARSYRDDTLLPPAPGLDDDDFSALYAPLDDVVDNPFVVGGSDSAALLLPLASPLDGTSGAGAAGAGKMMMLPVTTTTTTLAAATLTTTTTAPAATAAAVGGGGGFADTVLDAGFGADVGGFGASAHDFLGSGMDTFTSGSGMMAGGGGGGGGIGVAGVGVGVGMQNPQLQLQMSVSSSQTTQGLYELFGGGGGGGGGAGVDDGGGGGGGGGSDSQFSTASMMMDDSGAGGLSNPFAGIGGNGASAIGGGASSSLGTRGVPIADVSLDAAAAMDGLFADALNAGGLWCGGGDDASGASGGISTLLPISGGVLPLTTAFAAGGAAPPSSMATMTPATTQPLDPAAAAAATDAAAVDLGDGFFDEFMVDDES